MLTRDFTNNRADDKTAEEYALEGGATLHLVLALRGGAN
jgi:ubiquitin-like protein Nedd8